MENLSGIPVSVIIPLYNAEKFIGEALDSLLAQTFKNFEVIVVDDCSTDSSCAIVESYKEKFSGRLILVHMEENTGSGAMPKNKGLMMSRGEYVAFLDDDDLYTKSALEELYTLAKKYDADVVQCDNNYRIQEDGTGFREALPHKDYFVDKPTFESDNLVERVPKIIKRQYRVEQWTKLVRRNLIFEHEIFFPNTRPSDDVVWTCGLAFYAKRYLRVPNKVYIQRSNSSSITRVQKTPRQTINFWLNPMLLGLKSLDNFMSKIKFFKANPQYRYALLENRFIRIFGVLLPASFKLNPFEVYDTIKQEYGKHFGDNDVLISALCSFVNTMQRINAVNNQRMQQLAAQANGTIKQLQESAAKDKARIAELEAEIKRLQSNT
ncbi:MAG: glycosyltransferase [Selenomonadaceae bacterium]|nr:glycosyltransferase [Selenomonadaceae bacterium]